MKVVVGDIEIRIGNKKHGDQGVYVGRPTVLGNPFPISATCNRSRAIGLYRDWLREKLASKDPKVCAAMEALRRKAIHDKRLTLVCWCEPLECHAEVIADELAKVLAGGGTFLPGGGC